MSPRTPTTRSCLLAGASLLAVLAGCGHSSSPTTPAPTAVWRTEGPNGRAVWGSSASDVHAVGAGGSILHYDGSTWTPQKSLSLIHI